ncbi:MAG: hypothetical protein B6245_03060 [Desulfobacteraceae bacterium 4572_88]|nr:MAG: hypothetical protein B6245_03060 [Desulfobacteraceae bacterium 4572_88]
MPDPIMTAWNKEDKKLRKQGIPKKNRPEKPSKNADHPAKSEIALHLLSEFHTAFPQIIVNCVPADNLCGTATFPDNASDIFGGVQVVSKLKKSQNVKSRGKIISLPTFFKRYQGVTQKLRIRGGEPVSVTLGSARMHVCAHGKKRFVTAMKHEGENGYRYLVASDMSWRTPDIAQAHPLRWLAEVFIRDRKMCEGWYHLTRQPDKEGSRRSLILSLLCDHRILPHTEQIARIDNNLPACTVGSLRDRVRAESVTQFF